MARTARASVGGICYHVLNRGNAREKVFHKKEDYIERGMPYGSEPWQHATAERLGLEARLHPRGRPRLPEK